MSKTSQSVRFNVVSEHADGLGVAVRLQEEGYAVRMWVGGAEAKSIGDRMVPKVGDFDDLLLDADRESDIFIFDTSGNGVYADYLSDHGFAVLGASTLADQLERDRTFGYKVMSKCGIEIPMTKSFTDFEMAEDFVVTHSDTRWVYKPSKQLGDLSASHVSFDTEDMIELLRSVQRDVDIVNPEFELQAFEEGIALSTEMWFQHGDCVMPLTNHTLERKQLMDGDIGPSGGCTGNITWFCEGCSVCDALRGLVSWAGRQRYHGPLDLNTIITPEGKLYGLEFTPRFGYDATPTLLLQLVKHDIGGFLLALARGRLMSFEPRGGFAAGVKISIPPWPTEKYLAEENIPLRGVRTPKRFYPYNVKYDANGELCSAGAWGLIGLFTKHDPDYAVALDWCVSACAALRLKNKQYRTDLSEQFKRDLAKLRSAGVAINPVEYSPVGEVA